MAKILVVDDEPKVVDMICSFLAQEGHTVFKAYDGEEALESFGKEKPDLVVLDIMLPVKDGFLVLEQIRDVSFVPVILLTARSLEADKVMGFRLGADDYLTKPFSLRELSYRIKAILRRAGKTDEEKAVSYGGLQLNPKDMSVLKDGKTIILTKGEFQILFTLLSGPGRIFTREELVKFAFGDDYEGFGRNIDTHIWNLRRKIEEDPANPLYITTVYGVGYKGGSSGE